MSADERLKLENARLNEQVKLLVRTEQSLYAARKGVELQLRRIRDLNAFALAAIRTTSPEAIAKRGLELLFQMFSVQGAVAILADGDGAPHVFVHVLDGEATPGDAPADVLGALARLRPQQAASLDPTDAELAPVVAWLDAITGPVECDLRRFTSYRRHDVVLPLGARDLIVFRTATVTASEPALTAGDLPFLDVIANHVSGSMGMARLHATLEQRVADRTADLVVSNQQLGESLDRLKATQRELVEASRKAGMADVASSVLHNVGNVLNSVNVSATLVEQRLEQHRSRSVRKVASLLEENRDSLGQLLTEDPRGKRLPEYVSQLVGAIDADDAEMRAELVTLRRSVDHIKAVIMMQQDLVAGGAGGIPEPLSIVEVVEDALAIERDSYERNGIAVERELAPIPTTVADRHKILQILTNLLSNARHAVSDHASPTRCVTLRTSVDSTTYAIEVIDSGCGIKPENLDRVFNLGFTTKPTGHGFGLHSSACRAAELGGRLTCASDGPGLGARFRLELPLSTEATAP
jgi:signal transduction histidine kinase